MSNYITWNPWHGCHRVSEGCKNCYMFAQDKMYGIDPEDIRIVKSKHKYPIMRDRQKQFKVPPGSIVGTCLTSDFFLEEADVWRGEVWEIIKYRQDCNFFIITKRPERILDCLPTDWGAGYPNVAISVTVENQKRADERLPILLKIPCQMKSITVAPILEQISLEKYLATGQFLGVSVGGETDVNGVARLSKFEWYLSLQQECKKYSVDFEIFSIGSLFERNGKVYNIDRKQSFLQAKKAKLDLNFNNFYSKYGETSK